MVRPGLCVPGASGGRRVACSYRPAYRVPHLSRTLDAVFNMAHGPRFAPCDAVHALSSRPYRRDDKVYAVFRAKLPVLSISFSRVFLGIRRDGHLRRDMGNASVGFVDEWRVKRFGADRKRGKSEMNP